MAWLAPSYRILLPAWNDLVQLLAPVTKGKPNKTDKRIDLITGGYLEFWSLDNPDSPRGRKYKRVIWDESAMTKNPDVWPSVVRPLLADYLGDCWFLSTPRGRDWFWNLWLQGQDKANTEVRSWQLPTSTNPYIAPSEIQAAQNSMPERWFKQEFLAEFLEDGAAVFRKLKEACSSTPLVTPMADHKYTMGVDWGKSNDFTVISIWDRTEQRQVLLDRFNRIDWEFQKQRLLILADIWKPTHILAESNSIGSPMIDFLKKERRFIEDEEGNKEFLPRLKIQGFETTASSKAPLIEALSLAIERGAAKLLDTQTPEGQAQFNEFSAYELTRLPSGRYQYSAPEGLHDDTVIAGCLGWQTTLRRGITSNENNPFWD